MEVRENKKEPEEVMPPKNPFEDKIENRTNQRSSYLMMKKKI